MVTRGERSRRRILEETLRLAAARGYAGTTITLVSERSGLPASSVYWHFRNKDELLAAALEHGFAEWRAAIPAPPPHGTDLEDAARRQFRRGAAAVVSNPAAWRLGLVLALQSPGADSAVRRASLDLHRQTLDAMTAWWAGLLPRDRAVPGLARSLGAFYLAVLDGLYVASAADQGWDLEALADRFARGVVAHVRGAGEQR